MRKWFIALFLISFFFYCVVGWWSLRLGFYLQGEPAAFFNSFDKDETIDGYIHHLYATEGISIGRIAHPGMVLRHALSTLPAEGAVVVVAPDDQLKYNVMYTTIRYLSLPRPAYFMTCNHLEKSIPAGQTVSAIMLYLIDPPPRANGSWRLFTKMTMVGTKETEAWKCYCSQ